MNAYVKPTSSADTERDVGPRSGGCGHPAHPDHIGRCALYDRNRTVAAAARAEDERRLRGAGRMRFAYADPPYYGCCRLYDHYHPDGLCWDDLITHQRLIARLVREYPDGWALSCHTPSLRHLLPLCPDDVRIGAWVKPFHAYKKGVRPAYAWEPLIYRGGRNKNPPAPPKGGKAITPKDFVSANITLKKGLTGCKPPAVNEWILDLLNYQPGDGFVDLFPGLGGMGEAVALRDEAPSDEAVA